MTTKIVGSGLICLDIIYNRDELDKGVYTIGGSCGNVISILSYLDCSTYPIIPHKKSDKTYQLIDEEINSLNINHDLIIEEENYKIPIIIQENYKQEHKFKFKNPLKNEYLPKYKSLNSNIVDYVKESKIYPDFFYFDRCNLSNLELAKFYKEKGAIIFFEPSKVSNERIFKECLKYSDIVKYSHDWFDEIESYTTKEIPVEIKTLGSKGLEFRVNNKEWINQSAKKVINIIDTSGCGDICSVGLIYYLKNNSELTEGNIYKGLAVGQTMSAINCKFLGAKTFVHNIQSEDFTKLVSKFLDEDTIDFEDDYSQQNNPKINIKKFLQEL